MANYRAFERQARYFSSYTLLQHHDTYRVNRHNDIINTIFSYELDLEASANFLAWPKTASISYTKRKDKYEYTIEIPTAKYVESSLHQHEAYVNCVRSLKRGELCTNHIFPARRWNDISQNLLDLGIAVEITTSKTEEGLYNVAMSLTGNGFRYSSQMQEERFERARIMAFSQIMGMYELSDIVKKIHSKEKGTDFPIDYLENYAEFVGKNL